MSVDFGINSFFNDDRFIHSYGRPRKEPAKLVCTETLGFESMNMETAGEYTADPAPAIGDQRRRRQALKEKAEKDHELKIFPPFLTTLNCDGRPRFSFTRECTADGRIQMHMAQSERKDILRCFRGDGRLTMVLAGSDDEESDGGEGSDFEIGLKSD